MNTKVQDATQDEMNRAVRFKVTFEKEPGREDVWELNRMRSGAFHYGNGSQVVVKVNGKVYEQLDTRYGNGVMIDFEGWAEEYMMFRAFENKDSGMIVEMIQ